MLFPLVMLSALLAAMLTAVFARSCCDSFERAAPTADLKRALRRSAELACPQKLKDSTPF